LKNKLEIDKVATIDIGSNAIRLLISNVFSVNGKLHHTKNSLYRVQLRLGDDSFNKGIISPKNLDKLKSTLKSFKFLMDVNDVKKYLAYATSAMRSISNAEKLLKSLEIETGVKVEIITGKKESEIVAKNDISTHIGKTKNYCFIDVGGGSTEVVIYKKGEFYKSKSFKIGGVRLINGLVEDSTWKEFELWLKSHAVELKKLKIIGIGGNINKIYKLSGVKYTKPLERKRFKKTLVRLENMSYTKKLTKLKLNPDRIDVIVPAGKIYFFMMKTLGIKEIYVPRIGLADGMVNEII
jgi:exopolyphosphatase/guanosine-5'-triphosphate,3'-diphosphate pyrophosphatase|tara:strand:- start:559 stop:1443 length:885 start_codon:yes stop_codon:yes gene_type:complete